MNTRKRVKRGIVTLVAVVGCVTAVGVAPAMAAPHWSDTTKGAKLSGTLTVKYGANSATCTTRLEEQYGSFFNPSTVLVAYPITGEVRFLCEGGGGFGLVFLAQTTSTTSITLSKWSTISGTASSPWGAYEQYKNGSAVADFTNGSGATASTVTFSEDEVGSRLGAPLKVTGTLKMTNSSNGLLTILP